MTRAKRKQTIETKWSTRTYDVWGNARDGYEVNDSFRGADVELDIPVEVYNESIPERMFHAASPTDKQIRNVFGVRCAITTDGDDLHIMVNRARDDYPIGEMHCESHTSLSPIEPR